MTTKTGSSLWLAGPLLAGLAGARALRSHRRETGHPRRAARPPEGARSLGALAIGATAIGAFALGAVSIGALAIGRAALGDVRIGRLRIDRLEIAGR